MRKLRLYIYPVLTALLLLALLAIPSLAQIPEPDGVFIVNTIEAHRHVQEPNDQLYLITGNIENSMPPTEPVSETYIVRLMNGAVELGATTFRSGNNNGYDYGTCSIYFDAASAPAWNGAYHVTIEGNPTLYWLDNNATTAMAGAVEWDQTLTTFTVETAESNSAVANDMTLTTAAQPIVGDSYYFGSDGLFNILTVNIGTADVGWTGSWTWEYWNGISWEVPSGLGDGTAGFATAGTNDVTFDCPIDWQKTAVNGLNQYWLRFRIVTSTGAGAAQALGTQSWTNTLATPPNTSSSSISWVDEGSVAMAQEALTLRIRALAQITETDWGGTTDLIELIAGVPKLTLSGEDYFSEAVDNLRIMCPDLFADVMTTPEFDEEAFVTAIYTEGGVAARAVYGVNWYAQTFETNTSYIVRGGEIRAYRLGIPGNAIISIKATDGAGLPTGADLVAVTLNANNYITEDAGQWEEFTYADEYILAAETTYALVVRAVGGDANNYVGWNINPGGLFELGRACISADSGATWDALATMVGTVIISASGYSLSMVTIGVFGVDPSIIILSPTLGTNQDFMFMIFAFEGQTLSYRDKLAAQLVGTWADMTNLASNFGMSRMWFSTFLWIVLLCVLPSIFAARAAGSFKVVTLVFTFMLPFGALAGFIYLEVALIAAFFCAMAGVFALFYRGSP